MSKRETDVPELVRAAEAAEAELANLEALSEAAQRSRLDSEKNIARAVKELGDALEHPDKLATALTALAVAMKRMQERQQAALGPLADRARDIEQRRSQLEAHMLSFAALGTAAAEATTALQTIGDAALVLEEAKKKLGEIADGARSLFEAARSDDFPDVAREADALAKRLTALLRRLQS